MKLFFATLSSSLMFSATTVAAGGATFLRGEATFRTHDLEANNSKDAFSAIDTDRDGAITEEELLGFLDYVGLTGVEDAANLIHKVCRTNDKERATKSVLISPFGAFP